MRLKSAGAVLTIAMLLGIAAMSGCSKSANVAGEERSDGGRDPAAARTAEKRRPVVAGDARGGGGGGKRRAIATGE